VDVYCAGRVLRKTGFTTTSNGDLTLSDAEGTLKRRSVERQQDPLSSSLRYAAPPDVTTPNTDGKMSVTGPILTVNSVSNPASARQIDSSPAPSISSRRDIEHRRTQSSREQRYSFDDESPPFDWSATINLISQLDDGDGQSTRQRPSDAGRDAVEPTIVATHVDRSHNWKATLPGYMRSPSDSASINDRQSRIFSARRDYFSDSEDSSDWLERQRRRLHLRNSTSSLTPTTSTMKARIVFPPPRTELERRLIDELKSSQDHLNRDKSSHGGPRNGLYSSCTLPWPSSSSSSSSLTRDRSLTNNAGSGGRYSTLPGKGRVNGGGGVQRAASDLDFTVDTARRSQSMYNDNGFEKHQSLMALPSGDNAAEQRLVKVTVSRRTGALLGRDHNYDTTTITAVEFISM